MHDVISDLKIAANYAGKTLIYADIDITSATSVTSHVHEQPIMSLDPTPYREMAIDVPEVLVQGLSLPVKTNI